MRSPNDVGGCRTGLLLGGLRPADATPAKRQSETRDELKVKTIHIALAAGAVLLLGLAIVGYTYAPSRSTIHGSAGNPLNVDPLVRGDPKSLVIPEEDLPTSFSLSGGERQSPNEYSHVYFNPEAIDAPGDLSGDLLGVIVNLAALQDANTAERRFQAQGGLAPESIEADIRASDPEAVPHEVSQLAVALPGTDDVRAFRVHYTLKGKSIFEYRYRIRTRNAVVNLIISARATEAGNEPPTLESRAAAIVKAQAKRLNDAMR